MCLEINKVRKAGKDIVCYKVMIELYAYGSLASNTPIHIVTPFQKEKFSKSVLSGKALCVAKSEVHNYKFHYQNNWVYLHNDENPLAYPFFSIDEGFIHVYMTKYEVSRDLGWYERQMNGFFNYKGNVYHAKPVVYKCVIPAGTMYCRGTFGNIEAGCAQQIRFVEKLEKI